MTESTPVLRVGVHAGARLDGGMARYALQLVRALAVRDDIQVVPIATRVVLDSLRDLELADEVQLPGGQLPETLSLRFAPRAWGRHIDIFHGTRHLLPARPQVPTVLTVQDVLPLDQPKAHDFPKRWLLPHFYLRSIREATALIAASNTTLDRMLAHAPDVGQRAEVIPLGVASALLDATPEPLDGVAQPFALYVGDLSPRKNVLFLLELWQKMWDLHRIPLLLAGSDGWKSEEVRALLAQGVAGVRRLGIVSDAELRWLYEHAAVVLNASTYEGTGLPVAEALALGAPIVFNAEPALMETAGGRGMAISTDEPERWIEAVSRAFAKSQRYLPASPRVEDWLDRTVATYRRCADR